MTASLIPGLSGPPTAPRHVAAQRPPPWRCPGTGPPTATTAERWLLVAMRSYAGRVRRPRSLARNGLVGCTRTQRLITPTARGGIPVMCQTGSPSMSQRFAVSETFRYARQHCAPSQVAGCPCSCVPTRLTVAIVEAKRGRRGRCPPPRRRTPRQHGGGQAPEHGLWC